MTDKKKEMEWPGKDTVPNIDAIIRDLNENARTLGITFNSCGKFSINDLVNHPLLALKNGHQID